MVRSEEEGKHLSCKCGAILAVVLGVLSLSPFFLLIDLMSSADKQSFHAALYLFNGS